MMFLYGKIMNIKVVIKECKNIKIDYFKLRLWYFLSKFDEIDAIVDPFLNKKLVLRSLDYR